MTTYAPSWRRLISRTPSGVSTTTSASPGSVSSNAASIPASRRTVSSCAAPSRSGSTTDVSYPCGAEPSAGSGSRNSGT